VTKKFIIGELVSFMSTRILDLILGMSVLEKKS
jgi:hypothetical protein